MSSVGEQPWANVSMRTLVIVWFAALFFTTPAYPWGAEGHQAIGEAARTMLTSEARTGIQRVLGEDDLASIAVWLDDVRNLGPSSQRPSKE